jgi:predicted nuclease of restriction endonuclease-like (RecB) superfamily
LYERLVLSRNKNKVKELSKKGQVIKTAKDAIKDPYILEFLTLKEQDSYNETEFESALIEKLEDFLKELGKGFLFVGRQYRITLEEDHYHIDLVFYQRILRCFVLIDLKKGELKHDDIGQMQMYVNYFDDEIKEPAENKTIGIIMCKNKKESIVKFTLPKSNNQIFTSKYKVYLPDKKELQQLMDIEVEYKKKFT